uniref:Uncharacterized protein n=1 Tax=Anguilla anguilla TaxID=7936 RepID=A0A0E9WAE2_ANGAN
MGGFSHGRDTSICQCVQRAAWRKDLVKCFQLYIFEDARDSPITVSPEEMCEIRIQ